MTHYEPFKALGPIDWADLPSNTEVGDGEEEGLDAFLSRTFADALAVIESIPVPSSSSTTTTTTTTTGRARSATDSALRVPPSPVVSPTSSSSPSSSNDLSSRSFSPSANHSQAIRHLRREWRALKAGGDNPHGVALWKLGGSPDGRGSWFARRSVHEGVPFEKWKLGLEREFAETLAPRRDNSGNDDGNQDRDRDRRDRDKDKWEPPVGNVRGIGAERRVERKVVLGGRGRVEVYLLSVQFPGPTSPRDFVTLLMSADLTPRPHGSDGSDGAPRQSRQQPRQFMLVSRPCAHPDCAPRQGFVRGRYESVEIIREVPVHHHHGKQPLRKIRSSIDVSRDEVESMLNSGGTGTTAESIGKDAALRAAGMAADDTVEAEMTEVEYAVEWLMVTRSDPGGSVPRFMVEKGTPGGIVSDAGRFVKWLSEKSAEDFALDEDDDDEGGKGGEGEEDGHDEGIIDTTREEAVMAERRSLEKERLLPKRLSPTPTRKHTVPLAESEAQTEAQALENGEALPREVAAPTGFYGIIAGALEASGSFVVNRMSTPSLAAADDGKDRNSNNDDDDDDAASVSSSSSSSTDLDYASAEEGESAEQPQAEQDSSLSESIVPSSSQSARFTADGDDDDRSEAISASVSTSASPDSGDQTQDEKQKQKEKEKQKEKDKKKQQLQHEKDVKRLQDRRAKLEAKLAKLEERAAARRREADDREARTRDKHAKQEEKYRRELARLEEKRTAEETKKRRARDDDEVVAARLKLELQLELDRTRVERDIATRRADALKEQVGLLQAQNTLLVARLGRVLGSGASDAELDELRKPVA